MKCILILVFGFLVISCKQTPVKTENVETKETNDSTKFFEVTQFLNSQIESVNKTPYFIYHLQTKDGVHDSTAIDLTTFNSLAKAFLSKNINTPETKKYYTENVFFDETIKRFTLSYTTTNKDLEVQNIDVLLAEDGETVQRIFIKKFINYADSSASEQLSWRPDKSFQIIRLVQTKDKEISRQDLVVWNDDKELK